MWPRSFRAKTRLYGPRSGFGEVLSEQIGQLLGGEPGLVLAEDIEECPRTNNSDAFMFGEGQQVRAVACDEVVGFRRDRSGNDGVVFRIGQHDARGGAIGYHLRLGEKPADVVAHVLVGIGGIAAKLRFSRKNSPDGVRGLAGAT
jgi:hypothetical protein